MSNIWVLKTFLIINLHGFYFNPFSQIWIICFGELYQLWIFHQCLRYIWKVRNSMVFSNINVDSRDTFKLAETEAATWFEVQASLSQQITQQEETIFTTLSSVQGRWCFIDCLWKVRDIFSWQWWYSILEGFDGLMGTENTRASLSPLHAELEAFIWTFVKYEESTIISLQRTVSNWWR